MKMMAPYESLNPQFDAENHRAWQEMRVREPYVEEHGLVFLPPKRLDNTKAVT